MANYYKVLHLTKSASVSDIKKAYRKLALKWHPDKNPTNVEEATKRFAEISEAYEVLSDEKKKKVYDQYGLDGLRQRKGEDIGREYGEDFDPNRAYRGFSFRNPEDVFREFFGTANLFGTGAAVFDFSGPWGGHRANESLNMFNPFGMNPLGDIFADAGNTMSFQSFSTNAGAGNGVSRRTSTSTRFINGKKITTKRVVENGRETVMQYENDVLKAKTVDGVKQAISYS